MARQRFARVISYPERSRPESAGAGNDDGPGLDPPERIFPEGRGGESETEFPNARIITPVRKKAKIGPMHEGSGRNVHEGDYAASDMMIQTPERQKTFRFGKNDPVQTVFQRAGASAETQGEVRRESGVHQRMENPTSQENTEYTSNPASLLKSVPPARIIFRPEINAAQKQPERRPMHPEGKVRPGTVVRPADKRTLRRIDADTVVVKASPSRNRGNAPSREHAAPAYDGSNWQLRRLSKLWEINQNLQKIQEGGKKVAESQSGQRAAPAVSTQRCKSDEPSKSSGSAKAVPPMPEVDFANARIMTRNDFTTRLPIEEFSPGIRSTAASSASDRDPYAIQIGFDYGTSNSKCVYRDISQNSAYVYVRRTSSGNSTFLITSTICFSKGIFSLNSTDGDQYPENGLFYAKMALEKAARGLFNDPVLKPFADAAGSDEPSRLFLFVKEAVLFYLSRTLHAIRNHILHEYHDFGMNEYDDMFVNMAIPVSSAEDATVREAFSSVLTRAWDIALRPHLADKAGEKELRLDLEDEYDESLVANVYPEVSANVQAFINSPAASTDERSLYFFSDTGSGTVDQCCFTYTRRKEGSKLNYFVGNVHDFGSGIIERMCSEAWGGCYEDWRHVKEVMPEKLRYVTNRVEGMLHKGTRKSISDLKRHLYHGNGVSFDDTIRERLRIIFSGGGHMLYPYGEGVVKAFETVTGNEPREVGIPYPRDLNMPAELHDTWIRRLYVAYGLSFLYDDLAESAYPSDTELRVCKKDVRISCSCRGLNKQCERCGGKGWY